MCTSYFSYLFIYYKCNIKVKSNNYFVIITDSDEKINNALKKMNLNTKQINFATNIDNPDYSHSIFSYCFIITFLRIIKRYWNKWHNYYDWNRFENYNPTSLCDLPQKTNIPIKLHTMTCYIFAMNMVDWNQLYFTVMIVI